MKTILKKNQIIISVIAIMLIAAGYMNYTANNKDTLETMALTDSEEYAALGDAKLVSSENIEQNANENLIQEQPTNTTAENNIQVNFQSSNEETIKESTEAVQASTEISKDSSYFTESKLMREQMYSQMLGSYQKLLENVQISDTQKQISQNEIVRINEEKNAIMITENLIKNKGFEDVVIFKNGNSISIIVKGKELSTEQIAQIQNIVSRELGGEIEDIHISCKE